MRCAGVFAAHVRPPELHVSAFEAMAASYSARTVASVKASGDADLDQQVWEATLAEVEGGTVGRWMDLTMFQSCRLDMWPLHALALDKAKRLVPLTT